MTPQSITTCACSVNPLKRNPTAVSAGVTTLVESLLPTSWTSLWTAPDSITFCIRSLASRSAPLIKCENAKHADWTTSVSESGEGW